MQFEDNLFDSPLTGPEATRRTELMADTFGTYFATHVRVPEGSIRGRPEERIGGPVVA